MYIKFESYLKRFVFLSKQKRMEQGIKLKYKTNCGMQCGKILLDREEVQKKKIECQNVIKLIHIAEYIPKYTH